jgi:thymidylate synthase ThyX
VVTATDYDNWFWLRQHKDAMPEIQMLANMMRDNMNASVPNILQPSEWHLPYITERDFKVSHAQFAMYHSEDRIDPWTLELIKCSAARCARVSYLTHDGDAPSVEADLALYERLVAGERLHVSPVEHQATPDSYMDYSYNGNQWAEPDLSGNFDKGWIQYRKLVPGERHYFHQEAA